MKASSIERFLAQTAKTHAEPYGGWAQRHIPGVCDHHDVRCVHGDEINVRHTRKLCRVCGKRLRGDLPERCFFTQAPHAGLSE